MKKELISLKKILNVLLGITLVLILLTVCDHKRTVKKMLAADSVLSKIGSDFSLVEYNETKKSRRRSRVYEIQGKIRFDEETFVIESEIPKSSIHPALVMAKKAPEEVPFSATIERGRYPFQSVRIATSGRILSRSAMEELFPDGIVLVNGKTALKSDKNIKKLSDSMMKQKSAIEEHYNAVKKEYSILVQEYEAFKQKNFKGLKKIEREMQLGDFEQKLRTHQ